MRDELVSSAMENGLLEGDLHAARVKITRLQQHLRKALDDGEQLTASAAQSQAEAKAFQADAAQTRQRMALWEGQVADGRGKISELASAVATAGSENVALRQEYERMAAEYRDYQSRVETHLTTREAVFAAANAKAGEAFQALSNAQDEIRSHHEAREELRGDLDEARRRIKEMAGVQEQLAVAGENLRVETERAVAAEARSEALQTAGDGLKKEVEDLRKNLDDTIAGHELLELRTRFESLDTEHRRTVTALAERETSIKTLSVSVEQLTADLKKSRALYEDAERRAEEASEGKLLKDNEVLRGIVERQKPILTECNRELRQLRRGRFVLRTVYVIFGIALLALVYFGLNVLKNASPGSLKGVLRSVVPAGAHSTSDHPNEPPE